MESTNGEEIPVYATLGPEGSNHDYVLRNRLRDTGSGARILYEPSAEKMLDRCVNGEATHLMICAAHPRAADVVAIAQYTHGILLTETFIAASEPMAILCRRGIERPRSIALHPATRRYTSLDGFDEIIDATSTVAAFDGVVQGLWDCALTQRRFADDSRVWMSRSVEAARDAWLVLSHGEIQVS